MSVERVRGAGRPGAPRRRRTDALALPSPARPSSEQPADAPEPPLAAAPRAVPDPRGPDAVFAAQVLGQDGQKRGLRGGPEILQKAQASYLGAEWSGGADRRAKKGSKTKTEI
jgi:hypothetical protein